MPISTMATSVSSSSRQSVSGSPISLFWLPSATTVFACGRAERGEDVLRRRLRGRAGDRDDARCRAFANGAAERRERGEGVLGDERRGGPGGERVVDEVRPAADRDEEVARPGGA